MIFELVEYLIHRGLHQPQTSKHFPYHRNHHRTYQTDHDYRTNKSLLKSLIQQVLAVFVFSVAWSYGFIAVYIGWSILVYNLMHFISHTDLFPTIRAYHKAHHRDPSKNIGISSPAVDWFMNTMHDDFVVKHPILLILPAPLSFLAIEHNPNME